MLPPNYGRGYVMKQPQHFETGLIVNKKCKWCQYLSLTKRNLYAEENGQTKGCEEKRIGRNLRRTATARGGKGSPRRHKPLRRTQTRLATRRAAQGGKEGFERKEPWLRRNSES